MRKAEFEGEGHYAKKKRKLARRGSVSRKGSKSNKASATPTLHGLGAESKNESAFTQEIRIQQSARRPLCTAFGPSPKPKGCFVREIRIQQGESIAHCARPLGRVQKKRHTHREQKNAHRGHASCRGYEFNKASAAPTLRGRWAETKGGKKGKQRERVSCRGYEFHRAIVAPTLDGHLAKNRAEKTEFDRASLAPTLCGRWVYFGRASENPTGQIPWSERVTHSE